jgi:hypothetical protein
VYGLALCPNMPWRDNKQEEHLGTPSGGKLASVQANKSTTGGRLPTWPFFCQRHDPPRHDRPSPKGRCPPGGQRSVRRWTYERQRFVFGRRYSAFLVMSREFNSSNMEDGASQRSELLKHQSMHDLPWSSFLETRIKYETQINSFGTASSAFL